VLRVVRAEDARLSLHQLEVQSLGLVEALGPRVVHGQIAHHGQPARMVGAQSDPIPLEQRRLDLGRFGVPCAARQHPRLGEPHRGHAIVVRPESRTNIASASGGSASASSNRPSPW
jgi:hypothetical protein